MAIEVLGRDRAGRIRLKDDREDGSIILFACEEENGGEGVVLEQDRDDEDSDGPYPMLAIQKGLAHESFALTIDTTDMPGRLLKFDMNEFVSMALSSASRGIAEVRITESDAAKWGYKRTDPSLDEYPSG